MPLENQMTMNSHSSNLGFCVTVAAMRAMESEAMQTGYSAAMLMEDAGNRLGHALSRYFTRPGTAVAWLGKGHNAGDALIALQVLHEIYGWQVRIRPCFSKDEVALLTRIQWDNHTQTPIFDPADPTITYPLVILDGLLGIGANGSALREPVLSAANEINTLRKERGAAVAAIDVPSGINADTGFFPESAVRADVTFTLGAVKCGLILPEAADCVGSICVVPITRINPTSGSPYHLICPQLLKIPIYPRSYNFHKGMAGRIGILAGSKQYMGAAALASSGALAGGAGIVTLYVPRDLHLAATIKCVPEVIVKPFDYFEELLDERADSWVIGCGLGNVDGEALISFIERINHKPLVLDADALNTISNLRAVHVLNSNHLITPHPGEFERIAPDLAQLSPLDAARAWTQRSDATLLLKGCRSIVAVKGSNTLINSTGNPGMATAGMGDVLSGVASALLAVGHSNQNAGALASWLCGRAAELAIFSASESPETLRASHITQHLGTAFSEWKSITR